MEEENYIGIENIVTGIGTAGVGFVVVPDEDSREDYIKDCYRTMKVTINGGTGYGYFSGVNVCPDVMQNIIFPRESNRGTPVVWVKDAISNLPVIVGYLQSEGEFHFTSQWQYRLKRSNDGRFVEIFVDGDEADLQINILGDKTNPANITIKINSENEDSEFNVYCDNRLSITAKNDVNLNTNNKFSVNITTEDKEIKGKIEYEIGTGLSVISEDSMKIVINDKEDDSKKASFEYKVGSGFTYEDEFENKITAKNGEVNIISKKINLGKGVEPLVLGDTLVQTMGQILDAITTLTVMTPVGVSGPPLNSAQFTAIKSKLKMVLSKLSNTD